MTTSASVSHTGPNAAAADQAQWGSTTTSASPAPRNGPLDPLLHTALGPQCSTQLYAPKYFHRHVYGRQMVLSVDDDPVNQMVIANLLRPFGCKLIQAMNGWDALTALERSEVLPDAVLLDCMMPGMSGYAVCRNVRSQYGAPPGPAARHYAVRARLAAWTWCC